MSASKSIAAAAPIGIFDSGLGGLSVLRALRVQMPSEAVVYFADTANVPYGDKPVPVVCDLALRLTGALIARGCKMVLMASGTSTVAGLAAARATYPATPILGTVDVGARAAVDAGTGPVGVLATNATVQSRAFTLAVQAIAPSRVVTEQGCPLFVPLVEAGFADTADAVDAAFEYLAPLYAAGVQTVILGCTHFPFLVPALQKAAARFPGGGFSPHYVDPAAEAVREAAALLARRNLLAPPAVSPSLSFSATSCPQEFGHYASLLLGSALPPVDLLRL